MVSFEVGVGGNVPGACATHNLGIWQETWKRSNSFAAWDGPHGSITRSVYMSSSLAHGRTMAEGYQDTFAN